MGGEQGCPKTWHCVSGMYLEVEFEEFEGQLCRSFIVTAGPHFRQVSDVTGG